MFDPLDRVGRIRLDDGTDVRFGATACVDFIPAVDQVVFVPETTVLPGLGERAKSVHENAGASLSRLDRAKRKDELTAILNERIVRELGSLTYATGSRPVPSVRETLIGCGVSYYDAILAALGEASAGNPQDHPFNDGWQTDRLVAWAPFDPAFLAFANADGDAFGFFCHPALLTREVPPPIARFDHELHGLSYVSAGLGRALKSKRWLGWWDSRGVTIPNAPREAKVWTKALLDREVPEGFGDQVRLERQLVEQIVDLGTAPSPKWDTYLTLIREQRWPDPLQTRARMQWEDLMEEAAWNARADRITREVWESAPEVFSDELSGARM